MKQEELDKIVELHKKWLNHEEDGVQANLFNADIRNLNLINADLCYADLTRANMSNSNLSRVKLTGAHLNDANLRNVNLRYADLSYADIHNANLVNTDLRDANIYNANISNSKIINIKTNHLTIGFELACPEEGSFIGWKKVCDRFGAYLIKLLIPENAKRSSATTSKCRCEFAKVLEIINIDINESVKKVVNSNYIRCEYIAGEMVYPDYYDENRWNECSNGIHFFVNKNNALNY